MRLRFFVVDDADRLHAVAATRIEAVWNGSKTVDSLGVHASEDLPVLTALCDENLVPRLVFFLRLATRDGSVTPAARDLAYQAVTIFIKDSDDDGGQEAFAHQLQGWPHDWRRQLAVALDVPATALDRISVGGPLPVADLMGVGVKQSLRFFEHAFQNAAQTTSP